MKGKKASEKTRRKMSLSRVGKNTGFKKGHLTVFTPEMRQKISLALKGNIHAKGNKNMLGKHHTVEARKKIAEAVMGAKSHFWKGGISFEKYSLDWTNTLKRSIRERDKYTCQVCRLQKEKLFVHHIDYNKKNCNPDNLITLCNSCHSKTNYNRNDWQKYFIDFYLATKENES